MRKKKEILTHGLKPLKLPNYKSKRVRENMLLAFIAGIALGVCIMYAVGLRDTYQHKATYAHNPNK